MHMDKLKECAKMADEEAQMGSNRLALIALLALFLLFQAGMSMANYSGYHDPPMFGDFEAQRHWMEITIHLSSNEWYVNSTVNDLNYWGIDYPPLTAYHSWLLGQIAHLIEPRWVQLQQSRGLESVELKLFMRLTVICTMMALYAPALVHLLFLRVVEGSKMVNKDISEKALRVLAAALLFPGLLFIDCGHFQYNHCSLGLFLWALALMEMGNFGLGSALFVLALNHKQMELYHALPIAVFLLARSLHRDRRSLLNSVIKSFMNLLPLALIVLLTFAILWLPFLWPRPWLAFNVLNRIFPFYRGLFEDKVANLWCSASLLIKFKQLYSTVVLVKVSACLVLFASTPTLLCLFYRPNVFNFRVSLTSTALAFFLFSFQVHEKSILLAAIPALLLLSDKQMQRPVSLFLATTLFSLYPLCLKDDAGEVLALFIAYPFLLRFVCQQNSSDSDDRLYNAQFWLTMGCGCILCFLQFLAVPPARFPHLFPLLNAVACFASFTMFWLYLNIHIVLHNWRVYADGRQKTEKIKRK